MSIETMISEINASGLRVNNLSQRPGGDWQCNLREDGPIGRTTYFTFAVGATAEQALARACNQPATKVFLTKDMPVRAGKPASGFEDLL